MRSMAAVAASPEVGLPPLVVVVVTENWPPIPAAAGVDAQGPLALVVGSEGKGMRRLVREKCDFIVRLPMSGSTGSLNASVACGILLYEIYSQRFPLEK